MTADAPVAAADFAPPADLLDALRSAGRVALLGHVNPDADCLGSIGALALALRELGKITHLSLPAGSVSRRLEFLAQIGGMRPSALVEITSCDVAVTLDTARLRRVNVEGGAQALDGMLIANVDHHATNEGFGRWNWVIPAASSTCEMTLGLIEALGSGVTPTMATLLYAGLHSDTQGFSLASTSPHSLLAGHRLALAGAEIHDVCERLHRSLARNEFELRQLVYTNTRVGAAGRLAWSSVSHEELLRTGCSASDVDDQVEIPRGVAGVRVAMLLTEGIPGRVRINFRGEGDTDVLSLAQQFNGGGHRSSAGAQLSGPLPEVLERVVAAAERFAAGL